MPDNELVDELDLLDDDDDDDEEWEPPSDEAIAAEIRQFIAEEFIPQGYEHLDQILAMSITPGVWALLEEPTRAWVADHVVYKDLQDETYPLVFAWTEAERQRQEAEAARQEAERQERIETERQRQAAEVEQRRKLNLLLRQATGAPATSKAANSRLQPLRLSQDDSIEFGGPDDPGAPRLLHRTDGPALIYQGLTHSIAGESESGKTWLALRLAKEFLETSKPFVPEVAQALGVPGPCVAYFDFEQNTSQYQERVPALGITPSNQFWYATPEMSADSDDEDDDLRRLLNGRGLPSTERWKSTTEWVTPVGLVIIDDVSQAMSAMGYGDSNAAVTAWQNRLPNRLAARGITVVMLDHLVKANDGTGRYPLGGVMKLNGVTGAQYIVNAVKPISAGRVGETEIRVGKDRPGRVRFVAADWREYDKTARVGRLIHDARDPRHVVMRIEPPTSAPQRRRGGDLDPRTIAYVKAHPGSGLRELKSGLRTSTATLTKALDRLLTDKQIREEKGPRNARLFFPL